MDHLSQLARELNLRAAQVEAAVELLDDGNTVPFIARYRKEATGTLDEEQLRQLAERLNYLRNLADRRKTVLDSIASQGKLTPELETAIQGAETLATLEDLYLPFKPKRRTRAQVAREQGLEPLADLILSQPTTRESLEKLAAEYARASGLDLETVWQGARDICAEVIAEDAGVRGAARQAMKSYGDLGSTLADAEQDPRKVFEPYYEFKMPLSRLRAYQVLAINRAEAAGVIKLKFDLPDTRLLPQVIARFVPNRQSVLAEQLDLATRDACTRLLLPAIERDARRQLTEIAQAHAIQVFAANIRTLLLQPPLRGHTVVGIDPGFRTGCKIAVVDPTGKLILTGTIYPFEPTRSAEIGKSEVDRKGSKHWEEAKAVLRRLVAQTGADLFAIGNGTASRETEKLVAEVIAGGVPAQYLIVSEAGASVYSASPQARAEMPDLDVTLRGAVSIARRVLDPLAELVKIDPRSIGVGLYQHDLDDKELTAALDGVVESAVNAVGVDANTASPALLQHVAGIGPKLAEAIVEHRQKHGSFKNRAALRKVKGFGPKAYEQAAGFLRVRDGDEPLDRTAIHPESYGLVRDLFALLGFKGTEPDLAERIAAARRETPVAEMAGVLGCGEPTLADILEQLVRPGRDPRDELPKPLLRQDVLKLEDLKPGMRLQGTVRNVVDFGVFIDVGVKIEGLLHKSQARRLTAPPNVGDIIDVEVQTVDPERERIGLCLPGGESAG